MLEILQVPISFHSVFLSLVEPLISLEVNKTFFFFSNCNLDCLNSLRIPGWASAHLRLYDHHESDETLQQGRVHGHLRRQGDLQPRTRQGLSLEYSYHILSASYFHIFRILSPFFLSPFFLSHTHVCQQYCCLWYVVFCIQWFINLTESDHTSEMEL